ncbi:MAG: NADP-dependent malic enzyme [Patescibacteria group bacterium]
MDYDKKSLKAHRQKNVLKVKPNVKLINKNDLSVYYTPGIAAVSRKIAEKNNRVFDYTMKRNSVAIITDGSAVLGLGNIGPEAALPVMEGKALLFSKFANIDAFPICLNTQNVDEIVRTVEIIAPTFGGINLEDISAPRCFEIEERLQNLDIPVMHDDQHGTAIVVLAGLINSLKVINKKIDEVKIIISGVGAAGTAIARLIYSYSKEKALIITVDSKGAICNLRSDLNKEKTKLLRLIGNQECGSLEDVIKGANVFIGVSAPNILSKKMVESMAKDPIIFAMANPIPEINPKLAKEAGAAIIATGRSDNPNQINNVLAFPGIFRGALDGHAKTISENMKFSASLALANLVSKPTPEMIIPDALDASVVSAVAEAVKSEII